MAEQIEAKLLHVWPPIQEEQNVHAYDIGHMVW